MSGYQVIIINAENINSYSLESASLVKGTGLRIRGPPGLAARPPTVSMQARQAKCFRIDRPVAAGCCCCFYNGEKCFVLFLTLIKNAKCYIYSIHKLKERTHHQILTCHSNRSRRPHNARTCRQRLMIPGSVAKLPTSGLISAR